MIFMIDSRILQALKSRNENPAYSILITGYETKNDCNQEKLIIQLHQINKSLREIENMSQDVNVLKKELVIQSDMDYDTKNNAISSSLIGFTNYKGRVKVPSNTASSGIIEDGVLIGPEDTGDFFSHHVEMIETPLEKEITIEFTRVYKQMPSIIPTIEKKYQTYYKSYSIEFTKNDANRYTGVTITFNSLKRKNIYPNINIVIIGDKK